MASNVVEQVHEAYADCVASRQAGERGLGLDDESYARRSLQFRASVPLRNDDPDLVHALAEIGGYNGFDGDEVGHELARWSCGVTIAREYSVCLYVQPLESEPPALFNALLALNADEVDYQDDGTIRAWWD